MKENKQEAIKAIELLDLSKIRIKLGVYKEWTNEQASIVEKWYKRFLMMHVKYPGESMIPNDFIDAFWHEHILDTRKYVQDCNLIFGEFMHHNPSYGQKDPMKIRKDFEKMNLYYRIEFGEDCTTMFEEKDLQAVGVSSNQTECTNCNCNSE